MTQALTAPADLTVDMEPGTPVQVLPAPDGSNLVGADRLWSYAGPARHPYACVLRESDHGTTVHCARSRVIARPE